MKLARNRLFVAGTIVLGVVSAGQGRVDMLAQTSHDVTQAMVEQWMTELSNWGRWGDDDQLGALNLITPEKRKQAAALVREGISVSMSHDYITERAADATSPFERQMLGVGRPGPFVSDRLRRLPHLETDLHYYLGPDWRDVISASEATERYCERLREVCFDWPGGFVAHHYTRCLADLSGGAVIRSAMQRSLNPPDGQGFAFLTFDDVPSRPRVRNAYRLLLDTAGWDSREQKRITAEVRLAYHLNTEVFADLGRRLPPRIPRQRGA